MIVVISLRFDTDLTTCFVDRIDARKPTCFCGGYPIGFRVSTRPTET